ncbi:MAG: hypothetical protein IPL94_11995 [Tetrasphaera sp.]|nr:hypothetical protein [Tetrasphaera sp.]
MRFTLALGYSLVLLALWGLGLIASILHPSRGSWRRLALLAFGALLLARSVITVYVAVGGDSPIDLGLQSALLLQIHSVLELAGVTLVIAALLSSRDKGRAEP